jgi:hypothetical protein
MANHSVVHIEIPASDPKALGAFYGEVFGFKIEVDEQMNYVQFSPEDGPGGGFPEVSDQFKPGDVMVYFGTNDIEATLGKIEAGGGATVMPKTEIPGIGWFAIFSDPTGNQLALYTSANPQAE